MPLIDPIKQTQLRQRYNPDGSLHRRHQLRLLEMLRYIDEVCRRNNISYWLSSGTLLGAVRHGGFIPWDDDIDIEMLEEDYTRFLEIMKTEPTGGRYILQTKENDPGMIVSFAKLRDLHSFCPQDDGLDDLIRYKGCFVDIFVLTPSSARLPYLIGKKLFGFEIRARIRARKLKRVNSALSKLLYGYIYPFLRRWTAMKPGTTVRHRIPTSFTKERDLKHIFPLSTIDFEGFRFSAPHDPEAYLRLMFGDISLPPEEEIKIHSSKVELY